ncbi:MAG: hypothetical protein AAFO58_11030 [Pseudomonadota bacterium]
MRPITLGLAVLGALALAACDSDPTRPLAGPEIAPALVGETLAIGTSAQQSFFADGTMVWVEGAEEQGTWRVEGDQVCFDWDGARSDGCFVVRAGGGIVEFVGPSGDVLQAQTGDT